MATPGTGVALSGTLPNMVKRKRANGEGSISRRADGRYEAGMTVDTLSGRRRLRTTKRTRAEADRWLTEVKGRALLGPGFDGEKLSFGEYLETWLTEAVRGSLKESSYLVHRGNVANHLIPALGEVRLKKLTPAHFQSLYRAKLETLSAGTVLGIHSTARKALAQAVRWDLLAKNAAANAKAPRPEKARVDSLSREEARRVLEVVSGHRLRAMYLLALATGMRHGELLALPWGDVHLSEDGGNIAVSRTISRRQPKREGGEGFGYGTTKTGRARVVAIGPRMVAVLKERKRLQMEERIACPKEYAETSLVFTTMHGTAIQPSPSTKTWRQIAMRAGVERAKFHDLRHTAATFALEDGVHPKIVQEMLGHTSIQQTLDVYSHVIPSMQRAAAEKLESGLFS